MVTFHFFHITNSNLAAQSDVVGSILTYAASAPQGISNVRTGSQTSDTPTTYSEGMIIRRGNDIAIVLYDSTSNRVYTNRKPSATNWIGWSTFIQDADFASAVKTTGVSAGKAVTLYVNKLNDTQNYVQIFVDGVDKGYITFDVSRNIK